MTKEFPRIIGSTLKLKNDYILYMGNLIGFLRGTDKIGDDVFFKHRPGFGQMKDFLRTYINDK